MKILTHKYTIVVFENGRFCWRVKGWEPTNFNGAFWLGFIVASCAYHYFKG